MAAVSGDFGHMGWRRMARAVAVELDAEAADGYVTAEEAKEKELSALKLSGTKFRKMLRGGEDIPEWFAFKSVVEVLRQNA